MRPNYQVSSLAALLIACGGTPTQSAEERANQATSQSEADTQACLETTSTSGWLGGGNGAPSTHFTWELDAIPNTSGEDALVGLAHVKPATYTDLAAIVRFNPEGKLDARDGDVYRSVTDVPYEPGASHHLIFDIDTFSRTYSVLATRDSQGGYVARDFKYRSEQANADGLPYFGVKVDAGGPLDLCNIDIGSQVCTPADDTDGFVNFAFPPQDTFVSIGFDATPSGSNIDTVLGLSAQSAGAFDDIAAAVRFNPDGRIDARDGDAYRQIIPSSASYVAGQTYHFDLLIDLVAHAYTVVTNGSQVSQNLAFRTSQRSVAALGDFAIKSDSGSVTSCGFGFVPAGDAVYMHSTSNAATPLPAVTVPLPDGRFLSPGATQTIVYDAQGFAGTTLPMTGPLATDAAGDVYRLGSFTGTVDQGTGPLTSAGGVDVYVVKYDTAFNPVWSKRFGDANDNSASRLNVNARGDVLFALDGVLVRLDTNGNVVYDSVAVPSGSLVALDPSGNAFTNDDPPTSRALSITKRDTSGNVLWTQVMPFVSGGASIQALAADSTGGVVFAGEIQGRFAFPDGSSFWFDAGENGEQVFIAKLDATGARVYANPTDISSFRALTVDGLGHAAVSGSHVNAFTARLEEYGPTGTEVREISTGDLLGLYDLGFGNAVSADTGGNLYWSFQPGVSTDYGTFFVKLRAL